MPVTPTEFRRNLFQFLQRALDGETIEIEQKGHILELVSKVRRSKLDRLVARDILACTPDELEDFDRKMSEGRQSEWARKWESAP